MRTCLLLLLISINVHASEPLIVLIPGAGSSGAKVSGFARFFGRSYFNTFQRALQKQGLKSVVCPKLQDDDRRSLEEREDDYANVIQSSHQDNKSVVIVGHSMGGLIGRLLAQDPRVARKIRSVLTISTPHQGTPLADLAIYHEGKKDFLGRILKAFGPTAKNNRYLPEMQMTRRNSPEDVFRAQEIADNSAVSYFSISNSFETQLSPLLVTRKMISSLLRKYHRDETEFGAKNDGVVPEFSMIHGTYLGHLQVNHWQSACVDSMKNTKGCKKTLAFVIPIIERLAVSEPHKPYLP